MKAIWKFRLGNRHIEWVEMPAGAKILCVQEQHGVGMIWAEVDTDAKITLRRICAVGTGQSPPDTMTYLGTYPQLSGGLIWHVYDGGEA